MIIKLKYTHRSSAIQNRTVFAFLNREKHMIHQSEHLVILAGVTVGWFVCLLMIFRDLVVDPGKFRKFSVYLFNYLHKKVLFSPMSDCWLVGMFPNIARLHIFRE